MNNQYFNNTSIQNPQTGQPGAPSSRAGDEQTAAASHPGAFFPTPMTPHSPAPTITPEHTSNQTPPSPQFKGLFARPASIAPEVAAHKYTGPLPPFANMPSYPNGQAPANVAYAPAPPGFGPGFSAPDVAQPRPAQPPAQAPYAAQGTLSPYQTVPNVPTQSPPWQNGPVQSPNAPTQSPPWQNGPAQGSNAPTQSPPWQNAPAQSPPWQNGPVQSPPWQNGPVQSPPWQNGPAQSPPWQNGPVQNGRAAQGYPMPYPPQSQPGSAQRNTPPPRHMPPGGQQGPQRHGLPVWSRVLIGTLVVFLILGGSAYAYYQVNYAQSISSITNQQVIHRNAKGQVVTVTPQAADVLTGGRLNILLLGSDTDGKSVAPLAQTDIIVTIDPQTKYVGMLSIPRDLRLYAPSAGAIKLDEAFSTGWALPGNDHYANAVGMSIDTIEQNFGIPINYSAWVGLDGFVKVIDTVGGIDVDVLHPMVDDIYPNDVSNPGGPAYAYKRLYIAPGPQHLDGIHALEYVRTRHSDSQADFGRSVRQQQILSQLKNKLTQININQLPTLIQDLNGHVKTDMQISDIPKLMNFARGIDPNNIHSLVLSSPYSVSAGSVFPKDTSTDYIPVCSQILPKIQEMFDLGDKATCPNVGPRYSFPQTAAAPTTSNQVASTQPVHTALTDMTTTTAWQMLGATTTNHTQTSGTLAMGLPAFSNPATTEVHSLLDLMFMTVFESIDAART